MVQEEARDAPRLHPSHARVHHSVVDVRYPAELAYPQGEVPVLVGQVLLVEAPYLLEYLPADGEVRPDYRRPAEEYRRLDEQYGHNLVAEVHPLVRLLERQYGPGGSDVSRALERAVVGLQKGLGRLGVGVQENQDLASCGLGAAVPGPSDPLAPLNDNARVLPGDLAGPVLAVPVDDYRLEVPERLVAEAVEDVPNVLLLVERWDDHAYRYLARHTEGCRSQSIKPITLAESGGRTR